MNYVAKVNKCIFILNKKQYTDFVEKLNTDSISGVLEDKLVKAFKKVNILDKSLLTYNEMESVYQIFVNGMRFEISQRHYNSTTDDDINEILMFCNQHPQMLQEVDKNGFSDNYELLADMYDDEYFPNVLVDKVKNELQKVVSILEIGEKSIMIIQRELDEAICNINKLQSEFDENGSEIETVARESIIESIGYILSKYGIVIDIEDAVKERDW